jgi:hypothetical protein
MVQLLASLKVLQNWVKKAGPLEGIANDTNFATPRIA